MNFAEQYGPWALIAGASEGTGRSFARQIAAKGVSCILIARREAPLKTLADEIRAESKVECVTASVDLAATDATKRIVEAVGKRDVGLFVSNAGADPNGARFLDRDVKAWVNLTQRNVMTVLQCCHHFGGLMKGRKRGGILLVNSGAAFGGGEFLATYSASKAFNLCFAEGLWSELKPYGVHVLTLLMSITDTPEFRRFIAQQGVPFPAAVAASPDAVAKIGLENLPNGPAFAWGEQDKPDLYGPNSSSARRDRVLMINEHSKHVFGKAS